MDIILINKYKNWVFNALVLLVALFAVFKVYKFQQEKIGLLREKETAEIKRNEVLTNIQMLEKKVERYKDIINKKDMSFVVNAIGNVAKNSMVKIVSAKPRQEVDHPEYVQYPYFVSVSMPSFHNIGKFMDYLENSPEFYSIDEASIGQAPKTEMQGDRKTHKLSAELVMSTIIIKD